MDLAQNLRTGDAAPWPLDWRLAGGGRPREAQQILAAVLDTAAAAAAPGTSVQLRGQHRLGLLQQLG